MPIEGIRPHGEFPHPIYIYKMFECSVFQFSSIGKTLQQEPNAAISIYGSG